MRKGRLEAFSDGVIAIIITIMVLELKVPHGEDIASLKPLVPIIISYVLSFIYIGIYWNNHHHMMQGVESINGTILWANLHLLFWLSLVPFVTAWMGENHFAQVPVALYGFVLLMNAIAYSILSNLLIKRHGKNSALALAVGSGTKGKISVAIYITAILLSLVSWWMGFLLYVVVATIWFIPDKRIEKKLDHEPYAEEKL
ncbi:TMEM175 family protein [Segetibacter koreensis]|uniref:TMEM175 family protein n=1 Tax=Segetibacter koreensis TaxID=398037 RepID=UPI00037E2825|nr:TMEM175 family protein [Segetibacter koreensis]